MSIKFLLLSAVVMSIYSPSAEEKRARRAELAAKYPNQENIKQTQEKQRAYQQGSRDFDRANQINGSKKTDKVMAHEFHNN